MSTIPPPSIHPRLLECVQAGEDEASRQLVELLYPQVVTVVRRHLPNQETVEDLCQDVFIRIFKSLPKFRGESPIHHWARRIATNTCFDALRKAGRRPTLQYSDFSDEELSAFHHELKIESPRHETGEAALELANRLIETLNPTEQIIIRLLDLEEYSVAEVVAETGWTNSKIKVTAMRARRKLRESLEHLESTPPPSFHHAQEGTQRSLDSAGKKRSRIQA